MCGIVGFLDRRGSHPLGRTLLTMLQALGCRGPDSAGVALFGLPQTCWVLQVCRTGSDAPGASFEQTVRDLLLERATVLRTQAREAYLRLEVQSPLAPPLLEEHLLRHVPGIE